MTYISSTFVMEFTAWVRKQMQNTPYLMMNISVSDFDGSLKSNHWRPKLRVKLVTSGKNKQMCSMFPGYGRCSAIFPIFVHLEVSNPRGVPFKSFKSLDHFGMETTRNNHGDLGISALWNSHIASSSVQNPSVIVWNTGWFIGIPRFWMIIIPKYHQYILLLKWDKLAVWNIFSHELGITIPASQLTLIFIRGVAQPSTR